MEALFADRLPEFYEALAHHYQRGTSVDKAEKHLMEAKRIFSELESEL
jgi:hypothetical protein